jgi:hypothetical protein
MSRRLPALLPLALAAALTPGAAAEGEPAPLLANGSFERIEQGRPLGWELTEGARSRREGGTSDWFFGAPAHSGSRSLQLTGFRDTASWTLLRSEPIAVTPDGLMRLSAWMRTEDVRRDGHPFTNCNVGVAFESESGEAVKVDGFPVVGTRPLLGTHDWRRVERVVRVPEGAARARVTAFLTLSGRAWFDDVAFEPVELPDWVVVETDRFVFHEPKQARLTPEQRAANETNLAELEGLLELELPHPVRFYRYVDNEQKGRVTGRPGNAHAELPGRIHTIWPVDRHELVHVLTAMVGPAESVLLGEGLAVHLTGDWQGRPLDEWVRRYAKDGRLPDLSRLADWASFSEIDDEISYPVAGSFVRWLVETSGLGLLKQAYPRHGRISSPETLDHRLRTLYGATLAELEARWLAAVVVDE